MSTLSYQRRAMQSWAALGRASHSRKVILPQLLSNGGVNTQSSGHSFALPYRRQAWTYRHCDVMKGLEHLPYEERLRELRWVRLGKNRLWGKGCTNTCREGAIGLRQALFSGA